MQLLGIDIGSSSIKCALLKHGKIEGPIAHVKYAARIDGPRVEVDPAVMLRTVRKAVADVGRGARKVDAIALSVFSPGWVAMDAAGKPLTAIVTHQDRRSVAEARALEERVGQRRILQITGARPFPGGISSTTWAWFVRHQPGVLKKAALVGHLNTFLHRQFTGARVVDPANASFMGVFSTRALEGWSEAMCAAVGAKTNQLPEVRDCNAIGGRLTRSAAALLGLPAGMPMTVGVVDGSAAMFAAGAEPGQMLNVCGSTDVLALCTDAFKPHPRLLTRALGVGRRWLSVSTIASAGSAINWAKEQLFADLDWPAFEKLAVALARKGEAKQKVDAMELTGGVRFEPYLAGDRMTIEQKQASFTGLTLASTRNQMLTAMLEALAKASSARVELLLETGAKIRRRVVVTGGAGKTAAVFHRDWPGKWTFSTQNEATLAGLWKMASHIELNSAPA